MAFKVGDAAEVWSNSSNAWLAAVIEKVSDDFITVTYTVHGGVQVEKVIPVGHEHLRKLAYDPAPRTPAAAAPPGDAAGASPPSAPAWCAVGSTVEVWSASMEKWVPATVEEVAEGLITVGYSRSGETVTKAIPVGHPCIRQPDSAAASSVDGTSSTPAGTPSAAAKATSAADAVAVTSPSGPRTSPSLDTSWYSVGSVVEVWSASMEKWVPATVESVGDGLITVGYDRGGEAVTKAIPIGHACIRSVADLSALASSGPPPAAGAIPSAAAVAGVSGSPLAAAVSPSGGGGCFRSDTKAEPDARALGCAPREETRARAATAPGADWQGGRKSENRSADIKRRLTAIKDRHRNNTPTNEANSLHSDQMTTTFSESAPAATDTGAAGSAAAACPADEHSQMFSNCPEAEQAAEQISSTFSEQVVAASSGEREHCPPLDSKEVEFSPVARTVSEKLGKVVLHCPSGHLLKAKKGSGTLFSRLHACADCCKELPADTFRLSCKPCHFDLCDVCRQHRQATIKALEAEGIPRTQWEIGSRYFSQTPLLVRHGQSASSDFVVELEAWRWVLIRQVDMIVDEEEPARRKIVARVSVEREPDSGHFQTECLGWVFCESLGGKWTEKGLAEAGMEVLGAALGGGILEAVGGRLSGMVTGAAAIAQRRVLAPVKNTLSAQLEEALTHSDDSRISSLVDHALESGWVGGRDSTGPIRRAAARIAAKELQQAAKGGDPKKLKGALVMAARLGAMDTPDYAAAVTRYREVRRLPEGWQTLVEKRGGRISAGRSEITDDSLVFLFQLLFDATHREVWTRDRGKGESVPRRLEVLQVVEVQNDETWFNYVVRSEEVAAELQRRRVETGKETVMWTHKVETCQGLCAHSAMEAEKLELFKDLPTFDLLVPEGAVAGSMVEVPSAPISGEPVRVRVPHGAEEGESLVVAEPISVATPGPPLNRNINEVLLFHGTTSIAAGSIADSNFRINLAGSNAGILYGRGIYLAENASKSDEYCTPDKEGVRTMLLCRAVLGNVHYTDEAEPDPRVCESKCLQEDFNSVLGDRRKARGTYREFVVFDQDQVYPNFLIKYRRVF